MTEDKSVRYHRIRRRLEIAGLAWSAALLCGLLVSGGAALLARLATALSGGVPLLAVALATAIIVILHEVGALPLAWIGGLVVERRYGLSRQSTAQWLADHVKALLLSMVLAVGAAVLVYALIAASPDWWWLLAGALFALLLVAIVQLAPVLLMPLFFRLEPLEREPLVDRLRALASRAGAPVLGVYRWTLGDRTRKANAALAGLGGTRRILISDTLLEQYTDDEIEVVLAHELAHHVHRDLWHAIGLEAIVLLGGFLTAHLALRTLGPSLGLQGPADLGSLPLLALAVGAVSLLALPAGLAISRRHERRADRFALDLTRNPGAFLSAMRRLGAQNMAEESPSRLVQWLFYSHPPLGERLAAARRWQAGDAESALAERASE